MEPVASPYLVPVYVAYATVTVTLTIWLARILSQNGAVFLEDVFKDKPKLAEAVNKLLVVGFYLLNLGYAALIMKATGGETVVAAAEVLAWKLGALLLSLGVMHFVNLFIFYRIRRRSQLATLAPPVAPQMRLMNAMHPTGAPPAPAHFPASTPAR
jgi:hypothetical protein